MSGQGLVLGLIPARGGSKGIPGKNLRLVAGKPLIAHAIACGLACAGLDKLVVSTDSEEIAAVARRCGAEVPFLRPAELATDTAPMLPVMRHALTACESHYGKMVDYLILLDATAPLRQAADIEACLRLLRQEGCDAVVSANPARRNPYFNMVREVEGYARLVIEPPPGREVGRRQDAPPVYDLNTVVWGYRRRALMEEQARLPRRTRLYLVPSERAIDLDTELDLLILEAMLARQAKEPEP